MFFVEHLSENRELSDLSQLGPSTWVWEVEKITKTKRYCVRFSGSPDDFVSVIFGILRKFRVDKGEHLFKVIFS